MKLIIDIAGEWIIKDNGEKLSYIIYLMELYLQKIEENLKNG